MYILAILVLAALVAAYVSQPFWTSRPAVPTGAGRADRRSDPRPRAFTPVEVIPDEELELDRATGRLDAEDYEALRREGRRPPPVAPAAADEDEIERQVRALRALRAQRTAGNQPKTKGPERRK